MWDKLSAKRRSCVSNQKNTEIRGEIFGQMTTKMMAGVPKLEEKVDTKTDNPIRYY